MLAVFCLRWSDGGRKICEISASYKPAKVRLIIKNHLFFYFGLYEFPKFLFVL